MKKLAMTVTFLFVIFFLQPNRLHAQDGSDGTEFPDGLGETDVPFDGGISILVATAIAYGVKQGRNERKKLKQGKKNKITDN